MKINDPCIGKAMRIMILLVFVVSLNSCKSSKSTTLKPSAKSRSKTVNSTPLISSKAQSIIKYAEQFKGVKYQYGGTTRKGMDCSGLMHVSFKSENIELPRISSEIAKTGDWIDLKEVQPGDLVFFATDKNSRKVNHVGLVTGIREGYVEFIHASTSAGVITSSLAERYWYFAFVQARRLL